MMKNEFVDFMNEHERHSSIHLLDITQIQCRNFTLCDLFKKSTLDISLIYAIDSIQSLIFLYIEGQKSSKIHDFLFGSIFGFFIYFIFKLLNRKSIISFNGFLYNLGIFSDNFRLNSIIWL